MFFDFQKLVKNFEKIIRDNGKTVFDQWFSDLSFKSSVAASIFTFGLIASAVFPMAAPLMLILFGTQVFIDRYNLLYVYPLEFES